jgi:hypothetical protein
MYIEDLICEATNTGLWTSTRRTFNVPWQGTDYNFIQSLAEQIAFQSLALTEKQANHALKILDKHRDSLRQWVPLIDDILETPKWKNAFRVLPTVKTIKVGVHKQPARYFNGKCILVEFPYDHNLVDIFRKRNTDQHDLHKGHWDSNLKQWIFALTETNIAYLGDVLLPKEFHADDEFLTLYAGVLEVRETLESRVPMLVKKDNSYAIINAHNNVPATPNNHLLDILFTARNYGVTVWDDAVEKDMNQQIHPVTKQILSNKELWIDSNIVNIDAFKELLVFGGPALIIVPGAHEAKLVKQWTEFALSLGIRIDEISALFRLPNERADFNQYVRDAGLNNPVGDKTRIAFVSTKITKPLVKSGIKFDTVINLGYYNYMHFSMSTVVDNAVNLVYYSMKKPTQQNKWQPREL